MVISALPFATSEFARHLPGHVEATGYPNIHVKALDVAHNGKNHEQHGLPMYPLIMHTATGDLDLSENADEELVSDNIVEAFWSSAMESVHVPMAEFNAMFPAGGGQPLYDDIPCNMVFGSDKEDGRRSRPSMPREGRSQLCISMYRGLGAI